MTNCWFIFNQELLLEVFSEDLKQGGGLQTNVNVTRRTWTNRRDWRTIDGNMCVLGTKLKANVIYHANHVTFYKYAGVN